MNIKIIAMGKLTEDYHKTLVKQGIVKLKKTQPIIKNIDIIHINEEKLPNKVSSAEIAKALDKEADLIIAKLKPSDYLLCLDINGKIIKDDVFKTIMQAVEKKNKKDIAFVIGSSYGLSDKIKKRADYLFSLGKVTLNHQVVPALMLEILG